ncbi:hypothetical protein [Methanoplanus limicola]|uniref:Lipoprotein n=1 Tax=Methanoplanus limicola DSM 2279 TaxID=937775 RepID=H1Z3B0_9EURY|nr:hypothetical protein [Methanoplanus limicola]EHQ36525.1 hypothetical protein Metlim_2478 [Methanoplanus limicola DSM 2279]
MSQSYIKIKIFAVLVILTAVFALSAGCTGVTDQDFVSENIAADTAVPAEVPSADRTGQITSDLAETPKVISDDEKKVAFGKGKGNVKMALEDGIKLLTFEQNEPAVSYIMVDGKNSRFEAQNTFPADKSIYINKDGKYVSSYACNIISDGSSDISVETDSEWKVSFSSPQIIDVLPPQTFEGAGNQATPFFRIDKGGYDFTIKSENSSFIFVQLMDDDGHHLCKDLSEDFDAIPLPYQEGDYNGTVGTTIEKSTNYLLNINCDGKWTISVEKS